ncbi:alkaline phosphatase D [Spirosomataceae bacterium TFI 002]|nr:alkaline phosphatase D [Spirosomataceae bacterium TFI 002]
MKRILLICLLFISSNAISQLVAGPMLGYSEMKEVLIWAQTEGTAEVQYAYWPMGKPADKKLTDKVKTVKDNNFIAQILATDLEPSTKYNYEIHINGKKQSFSYPLEFQTQTLWNYRMDPPAFTFAAGSCTYVNETAYDRPGKPYGKTMDIFNKIYGHNPDFMVWGGDNIYLREVDWNTRNGIYHRYKEFKKQPELQALWANTHHYATWDDHDFGPNDSDRSYPGKPWALEAFKDNWGNPNYVWENEAVTGSYQWEDCQFYNLDDRWFRAPNDDPDSTKDYYGAKQLNWLIDNLIWSKAPFKFIVTGGQVVSPSNVFENMAAYPVERKKLLDAIESKKIKGLFFISGDRHHTVMHKLDREGTYPLYELTISPLTSNAYEPMPEEYKFNTIMEGTVVTKQQTFAIMNVSGKRTDRELKISVYNAADELQFERTIKANDLK